MRKLILIILSLVLLAVCSHTVRAQNFNTTSHNGIVWDRYWIYGSLGVDIQNNNKLDSNAYAPYNASFRAGYFGLNKGTIINTPANRDSILNPTQGMVAYDTTAKAFYGYNGTNWSRFDSTGGGSFDTSAIYYQLSTKQPFSDTGTTDATRYWVGQQGYLTAEVDGSITNELQTISKAGSTVTLSAGGGSFTDDTLTNYVAGYGVDIAGRLITVDTSEVATPSDLTAYVPYTGATGNVNIGVHTMEATRVLTDTIEPRTSAGLHIHNASHQDIMIAGAGGGQNLTITAPTNLNASLSITNSASAIGLNVQGSNTSFRMATLTTSAGAGFQGYNNALSAARSIHFQSAGANMRIGSGTINEYKFQVNGKVWINPDSLTLGSTGTDNIMVHSPGTGQAKYITIADLIAAFPPAVLPTPTPLADSAEVIGRHEVTGNAIAVEKHVYTTAVTLNNSVTAYSFPYKDCHVEVKWNVLRASDNRSGGGKQWATFRGGSLLTQQLDVTTGGSGVGIYAPTVSIQTGVGTIDILVSDTDASSNKNWTMTIIISAK